MLVEDTSEDHSFILHLPLRKIVAEKSSVPEYEKEYVRTLMDGLQTSALSQKANIPAGSSGSASSSGDVAAAGIGGVQDHESVRALAESIYHLVQQEDVIMKIHSPRSSG